jgi:hypothetical protein
MYSVIEAWGSMWERELRHRNERNFHRLAAP